MPIRKTAALLVIAACAAAACAPAPSREAGADAAPSGAPTTAAPAPAATPPTFVNHVWRVVASTAVAPGQLYVFLSDGTLVITSATGTPAFGTWKHDGDGVTMVEEGRPYRVDVLGLTDTEFSIRSHNPGTPVDIRFVRADGETAAAAAPR